MSFTHVQRNLRAMQGICNLPLFMKLRKGQIWFIWLNIGIVKQKEKNLLEEEFTATQNCVAEFR